MAAGENEPTFLILLVDVGLNPGQELGNPLDLVEHCTVGKLGQEATRIGTSELSRIGPFQVRVGPVVEDSSADGSLARLARSQHRHNGQLDSPSAERRLDEPRNVLEPHPAIIKRYFRIATPFDRL